MICKIAYIFLFIICSNVSLLWGETFVFRGTVLDEQTYKALDYATVQLFVDKQIVYGGITDANGHFELLHIHPGTYRVIVSYLGYDSTEKEVKVIGDISAIFYLKPSVMALNEVVVTASESKRATSASIVDRTAMKHLQPSSFSDLMELVPGGKSADPQMGQANLIRIRETGKTEDISSLGVGFYIDGISQNTDANLQYMPNSTSAVNATSTMSKGMDMRTISTDNIEKVEIIRGIPSVAYGNVANGAVIIQRKMNESPLSARFKADKTSKLFSVGKGIRLDGNGRYVLNADLNYLESKIDPRNSVKNYTRLTASARLDGKWLWNERNIHWNISSDYTGSFDDAKRDKDATVKEDSYKSDFNSLKIAGKWSMKFPAHLWIREVGVATSVSQQWEKMREIKSVSLNRPAAIATQTETGEFDGNGSHDVHRVGGDYQNGVRRMFRQLGNDAFKNFDVGGQKVVAGFAGFLVGAGGNDDDVGVFQVFISAGFDFVGIGKRCRVGDVFGFRFRSFGVLVDQDHFARNPAHDEGESRGAADPAGADDSDV